MEAIRKFLTRPTIAVFWAWTAVCLVVWAVSIVDGSLQEDMLRAVDYANAEGSEIPTSREDAAISFIYISAAYFLAVTVVGALVVHKSAAGQKWAFFTLIPLSLWWTYESVSSPIALGEMYPGTIDLWDWVLGTLGGVVWVFILGYTVWHHRRLRSNTSLERTRER